MKSQRQTTLRYNMKKNELIEKLELINANLNSDELTALIEQIRPTNVSDGTKLHYFVEINEQTLDPAVKYPKQMLTCYDILADSNDVGTRLSRAEVVHLIGENAELLNTKQDPERIYAFYQKRMEDAGWITREKERI